MDGNNMYMPKGAVPIEETYIPKGATPIEPSMPTTQPQNNILSTLGGMAKSAADFIAPGITKTVENFSTDIQKPQTLQEVGSMALGPLGVKAFGSDRQRNAQQAGSEILTAAIPAKQLVGSFGEKLAQAGFQGLKYGLVNSAGNSEQLNSVQKVQDLKDKTQMSILINGLFPAASEAKKQIGDKLKTSFLGKPENIIRKIIDVSSTALNEFRSAFGKELDSEIIKREGTALSGKNSDQIAEHFQNRMNETAVDMAKKLGKINNPIKTQPLVDEMERTIASLSPQSGGNIGTSDTINKLQGLLDDLKNNPTELSLLQFNNIKKILQETADYAKDAGVQSEPLKNLARFAKEQIEAKAPGIKEDNMLYRMYKLALDGAHSKGNKLLNKANQSGIEKMLQFFPALVGTAGVTTGNIGLIGAAAAGTAAMAARNKIQQPEVQTRILDYMMQQRPDLITRFGTKEKALEVFKKLMISASLDPIHQMLK